jgi:hypothetical protein
MKSNSLNLTQIKPTQSHPVRRMAMLTLLIGASASLTACYIVPIQPGEQPGTSRPPPTTIYVPAPQATAAVTFAARLYPANELAANYGLISAVVTNDLNGRGTFSTAINGESFTGEATRSSASAREGVANGSGNKGGYISCRYQMNSSTLGSGQCRLSNGALFTMHVGS